MSSFRFIASPVPGIDPVQGWELLTFEEWDGDGFSTRAYVARKAVRDVQLDTSRFNYHPTQDSFDWLVRNGFLSCPRGGWTNAEITHAILAERMAA